MWQWIEITRGHVDAMYTYYASKVTYFLLFDIFSPMYPVRRFS